MNNHNENKNYNPEVGQDSYTNPDGNTHSNIPPTSETVDPESLSHQNDYAEASVDRQDYQRKNLARKRHDNTNNAGGLLWGIALTTIALTVSGAIWYFWQSREAQNVTPTLIETPVTTDTNPSQPPQNNTTTIIERSNEVEVPVEVPVSPEAPAEEPQQGDVNTNVQTQEDVSEPESTPEEQTTPTQPQTSDGSSNNSSVEENPTSPTTTNSPNPSDSNSSTDVE